MHTPSEFPEDPSRPTSPATGPGHASRGDLVVSGRVIATEDALAFSFINSSGPGGQNVNKRATKCVLRVSLDALHLTAAQRHRLEALAAHYRTDAGELVITADEHRSQSQNQDECVDRLATLVRQCLVAPKPRKATKPTRGSKERRLTSKRERSQVKKGRTERHD
jgi:ribosome-associated protein